MRRVLTSFVLAMLTAALAACGNAPDQSPDQISHESWPSAVRDLSELKVPDPPDSGTPAPAEPRNYDVDTMSAQDTYARYYGYYGPWYSQLELDRGITVLTQSIGHSPGKAWNALLLARNDTLEDVGAITVTATLFDEAGKQLEQVTETSAVPDVRPGEPVPLVLNAQTSTNDVASVTYAAKANSPEVVERRMTISPLQTWPYGDREPQKTDWWVDAGLAPYPYVSLLFVRNLTGRDVTDDHLLLAWFDKAGHLDAVSASATPIVEGRTQDQLAYGQDFLIHEDNAAKAEQMSASQPMYWVWAK